jgi:hypothetical protein
LRGKNRCGLYFSQNSNLIEIKRVGLPSRLGFAAAPTC